MTITERQIDLVRSSAAAVDAALEPFAAAFYTKLFARHPDVRPLFPEDTREQADKLAAELRRIVAALQAPARFEKQVRTLGERHVRYGAEPAHYDAVGAVLLETFADQLGERFTPELREAWAAAYFTIAALMIEAQREAAARSSSAHGLRRGHLRGGLAPVRTGYARTARDTSWADGASTGEL
jgi:hemoglobin-like flavoprotein